MTTPDDNHRRQLQMTILRWQPQKATPDDIWVGHLGLYPRWPTQMTNPDDQPRWQTQKTNPDDKPRWPTQMTNPDDNPRWPTQMTSTTTISDLNNKHTDIGWWSTIFQCKLQMYWIKNKMAKWTYLIANMHFYCKMNVCFLVCRLSYLMLVALSNRRNYP